MQKLSDNSFIANLNRYQSADVVKEYDNISCNFNEIDGYRFFELLVINWEDDSYVYLTEKLKCFFEKNQMIKRKMFEGLKINSGLTMVNSSMGRILGYKINDNLFILVLISKVSFPMIGIR